MLTVPSRQRDGKAEPDPYLRPNYTLRDGRPHNYRKHRLQADEYLKSGPLGKVGLDASRPIVRISVSEHLTERGQRVRHFVPTGDIAAKDRWLGFTFSETMGAPPYPFEVRVRVTNHGDEAEAQCDLSQPWTPHPVRNVMDWTTLQHWRRTAYRGLHYLDVEFVKDGTVTHAGRAGIYVA